MSRIISILCNAEEAEKCSEKIDAFLKKGLWIQFLTKPKSSQQVIHEKSFPEGPGFLLNSGGSTNKPHQCLLPCRHLDQSAFATGHWLRSQGIEPKYCHIFNPLPIHHVSGLMPWWRSRCWQANHFFIKPSLMHNPQELNQICTSLIQKKSNVILTSIVPTQLKRLLEDREGINWLRSMSLIWIGGSPIPTQLMASARNLGIKLAPCYGATETTAMVTSQSPNEFLAGKNDLGTPLIDVELSISKSKRLQVRTPRLAIGTLKGGKVELITNNYDGWWTSGDYAEFINNEGNKYLRILGRVDNAIHSGGETVYLENLQERLIELSNKESLPIETIFFTPIEDEEWGQRYIALIRLYKNVNSKKSKEVLSRLKHLLKAWSPHERPMTCYLCPELQPNDFGKWELEKWKAWVKQRSV